MSERQIGEREFAEAAVRNFLEQFPHEIRSGAAACVNDMAPGVIRSAMDAFVAMERISPELRTPLLVSLAFTAGMVTATQYTALAGQLIEAQALNDRPMCITARSVAELICRINEVLADEALAAAGNQ